MKMTQVQIPYYLTPSPLDPEQSQQTAGQQTDTTQPPEPASYTDIDSFISKVDATPSAETNSKPIVKLPSGQAGEYITYEVGLVFTHLFSQLVSSLVSIAY